jgi:hypothetical protein
MIAEFERSWNEGLVTYFNVQTEITPVRTEKNHIKAESGQSVFRLWFELGTSRMQVKKRFFARYIYSFSLYFYSSVTLCCCHFNFI